MVNTTSLPVMLLQLISPRQSQANTPFYKLKFSLSYNDSERGDRKMRYSYLKMDTRNTGFKGNTVLVAFQKVSFPRMT